MKFAPRERWPGSLGAFARDKNGQVSIIVALSALPALALAGAGIDYSRLTAANAGLQSAVDSAVLGAQLQNIASNSALQAYVQGQMTMSNVTVASATYTAASSQMCATVTKSVPTAMMKIVNVNTMTATATACSVNASATTQTFEIALALDNTGSMAVRDTTTNKTKVHSEIDAAKSFVNQMFTNAAASSLSVSVVPFTTAVNVGTQYANASWMDTSGRSSIHWENFPKQNTTAEQAWSPTSRFALFSEINQNWGGCVEERPEPYTLTDTAADVSNPDTLFVPMFAPDESDSPNTGYRSYNSYLSDTGGFCASGDAYAAADSTGTYSDGTRFFGDGQNKLCKYAVKWAANNPSAAQTTADVTSVISDYMANSYVNHRHDTNNWNINSNSDRYNLTPDQAADLIVSNNLYSVNAGNTQVSFCTDFSVGYRDRSNSYYVSSSSACYSRSHHNSTFSPDTTADLPANYVNNPQGTPSANNAVANSGYTASSAFSPWKGSGWNYGGNGWGTGSGFGWGGTVGNTSYSSGFNASATNPGYTASGASSNLYVGRNQFNLGGGANSGCDSTLPALQTLTTNKGTTTSKLEQMTANGATNLVSGLLWAWRTISPNGPFTSGGSPRAYGAANNRKIIIFMTDGYNNWEPDNSQNGGVYSSFGYYHNNRIGSLTLANGTTASAATASNNRSYLDAAFLKACANAKNAGVEVYTIAFSIPNAPIDAQGKTVLQSCASDTGHYMVATNGTELADFFSNIGASIMEKSIRLVN